MDRITRNVVHLGPPALIRNARKFGIYLPELFKRARLDGFFLVNDQIDWALGYMQVLMSLFINYIFKSRIRITAIKKQSDNILRIFNNKKNE